VAAEPLEAGDVEAGPVRGQGNPLRRDRGDRARGGALVRLAPAPHDDRVPRLDADARAGGAQRILLVEDDASVAEFTRQMLESLGYGVVHAPSAAQALSALRNANIDLVLSDVMMPGGMSGAELADAIRRDRPELPIVLVTGYPDAVHDAEPKGLVVLTKPYELAALADAISAAATR